MGDDKMTVIDCVVLAVLLALPVYAIVTLKRRSDRPDEYNTYGEYIGSDPFLRWFG